MRFAPYIYLLEGVSLGKFSAEENFFLKKMVC